MGLDRDIGKWLYVHAGRNKRERPENNELIERVERI